ncbi:MAG: hypothetical protein NTV63_01200 [Candidatus Woesearchaeota archaeon]|nr:hypothetical protein [Candidatus Woesearchaeota archaeon]
MEKFQEARDTAKRYLSVAEHIVYVTFPLIKENRLLPSIVENIFLSLSNGINAVLYYDLLFKNIRPFSDDFTSRASAFRESMKIHRIEGEYLALANKIWNIILLRKKSPIVISKGDSFVICDEKYRTEVVSMTDIKEYLSKTKIFIAKVSLILSENEGIFTGCKRRA